MAALSKGTSARFQREQFFPQDWTEITAEFLALFHRYSYICKPLGGGNWFSANEQWKLTDTEILKAVACAHPKHILGCRAGKATRYAVLDIDAGSKHHNLRDLNRIRQLLAKSGIGKTDVYRSSESGGWHLYIFFDEPVSSKDLRNQLVQFLKIHNFVVAKGTMEVFPHPGDASIGQGLRLPLQRGFAWLDQKTLEVEHERTDISATKALELFVDALNGCANSRHDFHQLKATVERVTAEKSAVTEHVRPHPSKNNVVPIRRIEPAKDGQEIQTVGRVFGTVPPGLKAADWVKGREFYVSGLTGASQRAEAIFTLGHYLFYGDPELSLPAHGYGCEQQRAWIIEQILNSKHNGYSKDISRGRADAISQVFRATSWLPPHRRGQKQKAYAPQVPVAWTRANANRGLQARKRIEQALAELEGKQFSLRDLRTAAKCSMDTVYKNKDLWQAAYEKQSRDHLACDPGEYNAGVGEGSSENPLLTPFIEKMMPPGRLAARRIVYELGMRDRRAQKRKAIEKSHWLQSHQTDWNDRVLNCRREDLGTASIDDLKLMITEFQFLLYRSPDLESENWLREILRETRESLANRQQSFVLHVANSSDSNKEAGELTTAKGEFEPLEKACIDPG